MRAAALLRERGLKFKINILGVGDREKELKSLAAPVHWAMGMFDGVHLGHAGVIAAAVKGAVLDGGIPAVLTFRTHPLARVRPESVPPMPFLRKKRLHARNFFIIFTK